jgi:hypothetical protein
MTTDGGRCPRLVGQQGEHDMAHQIRFNDRATTAEIVISAEGRNALDRAGIVSLHALFDEVLTHASVRTLIISGADGNFCAGRIRDGSLVSKDGIATDLEPIRSSPRSRVSRLASASASRHFATSPSPHKGQRSR